MSITKDCNNEVSLLGKPCRIIRCASLREKCGVQEKMQGRNLYFLLLLTTLHGFLMGHQMASHDFAHPYNDLAIRDEDSIVNVPSEYEGGSIGHVHPQIMDRLTKMGAYQDLTAFQGEQSRNPSRTYKYGTFPPAAIEDSVGGKEVRHGISDMGMMRFPGYDSYRQRSNYFPRRENMWQRSAEYEDYDPILPEEIRRIRRNNLEPGLFRGLNRWRLNDSPRMVRRDVGGAENDDQIKIHEALRSPFTVYSIEPHEEFPIDDEKPSEYEGENIDHAHPQMMDHLTKLEAFQDLAALQGEQIQNPSRTLMMRRSIPLQISNSLTDDIDDDVPPSMADQYRDAFGALPSVGLNGEIPRAKRVKRTRFRRPIRSINRKHIRVL